MRMILLSHETVSAAVSAGVGAEGQSDAPPDQLALPELAWEPPGDFNGSCVTI